MIERMIEQIKGLSGVGINPTKNTCTHIEPTLLVRKIKITKNTAWQFLRRKAKRATESGKIQI